MYVTLTLVVCRMVEQGQPARAVDLYKKASEVAEVRTHLQHTFKTSLYLKLLMSNVMYRVFFVLRCL